MAAARGVVTTATSMQGRPERALGECSGMATDPAGAARGTSNRVGPLAAVLWAAHEPRRSGLDVLATGLQAPVPDRARARAAALDHPVAGRPHGDRAVTRHGRDRPPERKRAAVAEHRGQRRGRAIDSDRDGY